MSPRQRMTRGFTLIELIAGVVVLFAVSALLLQLGGDSLQNYDAPIEVDIQYETLQEAENLVAEYRARLENDALSLGSMLSGWSPGNGVDMDVQQISLTDTGGSYTVGARVYKVTLTLGDQSVAVYLTE